MGELADARTLAANIRDAATHLIALLDKMDAPPASAIVPALHPDHVARPIAWGARVSALFVERIWWTAVTLGFDPDWLMACIAFETGEKFTANVKNMAGSGATGLLQFMPATAKELGTTTAALAQMDAEKQINFVYKYFKMQIERRGPITSLADCYMAILLPSAVGKPDNAVLFSEGVAYRQNSGLDANRDGQVTKIEAAAKVIDKLAKGRQPGNMGTGR